MLNLDNETMINSSNEALSTYIPEYETTTDTLPLTIAALEDPISEFIRYGKCTQTETPSPTVPAPIVCNCGEITHEMLGYQYDTDEEIEDPTIVHKDYTPETITINNTQQIIIPPLFSMGNVKDEFDVLTGKITRRIGYKIFDGTEDWDIVSSSNVFR